MSVVSRRLVLGGVLVASGLGLAAAPPPVRPTTEPVPRVARPAVPATRTVPDAIRAVDPLGAMLADARTAYGHVRDYTCVFTRQERVNGTLSPEQVAEMRVRVQPYSVYIRFGKPESVAGLEMAYVTGARLGKMRFRPAGFKPGNTTMAVSLDDPKVMAATRHRVTELGIGSVLDRLAASVAREKGLGNPVEVFTADYKFAGRDVTQYEVYTRRPHALRYAYKCVVYVDKESRLPLRFEAYDQPKPGQTAGELFEAYSFSGLKINPGLGESAFE